MRRVWLVLLCAALVPVRVGVAAAATEDRGIVVRLQARAIAIRELDGTRARFVVNRTTAITLDGRRVRLRGLRRGDVAVVDHAGRTALAIRAFRP